MANAKKPRQFETNKLIAYITFTIGLISFVASAIYGSSTLAFIGSSLTFWGALLLYVTPTKHVKLELLNAAAIPNLANIDKVIANMALNGKGIYLPPKCLKDLESSLIFIPIEAGKTLPELRELDQEKLFLENPKGVFLTPPGLALLKLFEKELGTSFTKTDLGYVQSSLPKLFIKYMEIAENLEVKMESNTITIEITNHIFNEVCRETMKHKKIHESLGCPLCSAIACALAKASGKPITIEREELSEDGRTTKIQYQILEG